MITTILVCISSMLAAFAVGLNAGVKFEREKQIEQEKQEKDK